MPRPVHEARALGLVLGLALLVVTALAAPAHAEAIPAVRQSELLYILEQDCGSCHGLTLKGGLGPALLPGDLTGRAAVDLAEVIMDGIHGTPMPPWRALMSADEALWMAHILKSGEMLK